MPTCRFMKSVTLCQINHKYLQVFAIENVNFYKYSMCLCGNLGILKDSGQYSTLAPCKRNELNDFVGQT